jgi:hypothetical protein
MEAMQLEYSAHSLESMESATQRSTIVVLQSKQAESARRLADLEHAYTEQEARLRREQQVHTHTLIHSYTHPLIHSFTHPLIHSCAHPPIHSGRDGA